MPTFVRSVFAHLFLGLAATLCGAPLAAEIVEQDDRHFVTRDEAVVEADLKQTWLALIQPSTWWSSAHTWSGDAANLSIVPQGGGCFCERIPEVDEPGRFTLEGSVEHMRVIQAYPEQSLRMVGALGPLQSEPVIGVLTIVLSKVQTETGTGTRIVWEYNVGGSMRYDVALIAKAVDGVMSQQLAGLAKLLGPAKAKAGSSAVAPKGAGAADKPSSTTSPTGPDTGAAIEPQSKPKSDAPAQIAPKSEAKPATTPATKPATTPATKPTPQPAAKPAPKSAPPKRESVDEAFGDLKDEAGR